MDEEMEDFIVECSDVYEIDSEYEFDAARFYDFCRPESTSDAEEAERWFQTAGNYLPSRKSYIKNNLHACLTAFFWLLLCTSLTIKFRVAKFVFQ